MSDSPKPLSGEVPYGDTDRSQRDKKEIPEDEEYAADDESNPDKERYEKNSLHTTNRSEPLDHRGNTSSPTHQSHRDSPISVTYSDDGVDTLITDHCQSLNERLNRHTTELKSTHFKNYTGMTDLQKTANHVSSHMKHNQVFISNMVAAFEETAKSLDLLNSTIIHKLQEEHLETWIDRPIKSQDVIEQSGSRQLMQKAAELREIAAKTELEIAEAMKMCAELELATVESQQLAVQAIQAAEEAVKRAEEAERAAQTKAKMEEEKRRKAEELAKRQAEEEKVKREFEEKRKAEMEKLKGTPEEQERLNPNNWPTYTYKSPTSTDFDGSYSCIIRAMPGVLAQDDVTVRKVSQLESGLSLDCNDELIGNIISITPAGETGEEGESSRNLSLQLSAEEPLSVLMPHCAPRSIYKDITVMWKQFQDFTWKPLDAKECSIESIKEAKLVECRPSGFGMFAVIHRLKTDNLIVTRKGGKLVSSIDSRLCVQCRPGAFKVNTPFTLQIQPVDLASVSDVKLRFPEDCGDLISSSPIITMAFPTPTLHRPISIIIPIPANSTKPKRPMTAVDKERGKPPSRPASAFGLGSYKTEEADEVKEDGGDQLHLLALASDGHWYSTDKMEYFPQNKKGDLICINTTVIPNKFWLIRTKASTAPNQVEILADIIYDYLHKRVVQFIMRQKTEDPTDITLVCAPMQRIDRTIRRLDEEGYTDGTKISQEVFVREGQKIEVRFRGNLQPDEDVALVIPFNSQLKTQVSMYIAEIDKYAQKSFSSYRGFAQFYIEGMITRDIYDEADKKKGDQRKPIATEEVWDMVQLAELQITLPKPEPEAPKPLKKAKLNLTAEGPIDDALLKQLSTDLGDEWKILATHLNVKNTRIQSIMRNHAGSDSESGVYEMLLTWLKRVPRSMDKVKVLCEALRAVGRLDLVEDVKDREYDYKQLRAEQLKDAVLKQLFVKIAQHPSGVSRWKEIAGCLHVPASDLMNLENEYSKTRERCIQALEIWKRNQDSNASPHQLLRVVKHLRMIDLASEIRRIINH